MIIIDPETAERTWRDFKAEAEKDDPNKMKLFELYANITKRAERVSVKEAIDFLGKRHGWPFVVALLNIGQRIPKKSANAVIHFING